MALIVETGEGLADAESYNTLEEISAYNAAHNAVAAWDDADEADQERFARNAFQYLEAEYNERWNGTRLTETQAGAHPRTGVYLDGILVADGTLPRNLKHAHAELSIRAASGELMPDVAEPGSIESESVKVGPIETSTTYVAGKSQTPDMRIVRRLLRGLIGGSSELERR